MSRPLIDRQTMDMPARLVPLDVPVSGPDLLRDPLLNKGTAFSETERDAFGLHGLLPPHVGTLEAQLDRRLKAFRAEQTAFEKYVFLRGLQDSNETLFYALLGAHLEEMLPIVYTPTVGEACERFSERWSKPRGLFISWPQRQRIDQILSDPRLDSTEVIVVSDGERILGLGDQGAGGMGIPIGKLSLYTACAGLHPSTTLPILLDVGTDNEARLADPLYVGWRNHRVRGQDYDDFVDAFVTAVSKRWPNVLLQWEDFARQNAGRMLERYRDRLCTFNDDIQGTAAVAAGTLLSAIQATGGSIADQRVVIVGAGTAGIGIATLLASLMRSAGLSDAAARARFFAVDRAGLLVSDMADVLDFQRPFAQDRAAVASFRLASPGGRIELLDVIENARPTTMIGVSGQPGAFTEAAVRAMARHVERPVIFPLSNPTSRAEASPHNILAWTDGRALVGTGSPFPPVTRDGLTFKVDQTNNSYVFPGVGLGVLAVGARRVTDRMFEAAARTLAEASPVRRGELSLLPPVHELRLVARLVAKAVARAARDEGLCPAYTDPQIDQRVDIKMWRPMYRPYRFVPRG